MNFGGTTFGLAIIARAIGGWMFTTWIRAKHGYPVENEWGGTVHRTDPDADRKIALLTDDNAKLAGQVSRLEERISVLERIATEEGGKAAQLADQIDRLSASRSASRSEEHTSELQSLMRISYAVFFLKKQKNNNR